MRLSNKLMRRNWIRMKKPPHRSLNVNHQRRNPRMQIPKKEQICRAQRRGNLPKRRKSFPNQPKSLLLIHKKKVTYLHNLIINFVFNPHFKKTANHNPPSNTRYTDIESLEPENPLEEDTNALYTNIATTAHNDTRYTEINATTEDSTDTALYTDIASSEPGGDSQPDNTRYTEIESIIGEDSALYTESGAEGNGNQESKRKKSKKGKKKRKSEFVEELDLPALIKQTDPATIKEILMTHAKDHRAHLYRNPTIFF